jgi:hypothetical protein
VAEKQDRIGMFIYLLMITRENNDRNRAAIFDTLNGMRKIAAGKQTPADEEKIYTGLVAIMANTV